MKKLNKIYKRLLSENIKLTSPNGKKITNAIKKRNPISFYYNGPKGEVKPGRRIRVEPVALGLSKGGNLVVRGYVQPPSESKRGFTKHGWRLFRLDRLSSLIIDENSQFNMKRSQYKEGDDGSMTVTYVTTSWADTPADVKPPVDKKIEPTTDIRTPEEPQVTKPEPTDDNETEIQSEPETTTDLPQPKNVEKPSPTPGGQQTSSQDVFTNIEKQSSELEGLRTIDPEVIRQSMRDLYLKKLEDWKNTQKSLNLNTTPGEGTRRKFEKDSELDIYKFLKDKNINVQDRSKLQESIDKIKSLMFF